MNNIANKFYIVLVAALCAVTYLVNFCNKISDCALILTFLALIVITISELYGKQNAMKIMLLSIFVSFCLAWNGEYYISGRIINQLQLASLLSIMLSTYFCTSVLARLKPAYSLPIRSLISLTIWAVSDGFIMSGFLANHFSAGKILAIFCKDLSFKCFYSLIAYLVIYFGAQAISKIYKQLSY